MTKQVLFEKLWACYVDGEPVSEELIEQAHIHGLQIEAVEEAALSLTYEDDLDE